MAKIFSAEKLSLNGDQIRIKTDGSAGTIRITNSAEDTTYFRETDISSLQTVDSTNKSSLDANISSLQTVDSTNKSSLDADVSSLQTVDSTNKSSLDSNISSLAASISSNDTYASSNAIDSGAAWKSIDYSAQGFASAPAVVATLMSYDASDPILGVMLSGAPGTSSAMFVFSDEIPSTGYKLEVLAAI
jgi:hypothetical protein